MVGGGEVLGDCFAEIWKWRMGLLLCSLMLEAVHHTEVMRLHRPNYGRHLDRFRKFV